MLVRTVTAFGLGLLALCAPAAGQVVVLDGDDREWAAGRGMAADENFLYFRFELGRLGRPGDAGVTIEINSDGDTSTGEGGFGAEVVIDTDPPSDGSRWRGPGITSYVSGRGEEVEAFDADLHIAPTHASEVFEARIGRSLVGLESAGLYLARVTVGGESFVVGAEAPEASGGRYRIDAEIPARADGALRVMAWNTLWASQLRDPEPFARVFDAVRPDVVLFQEWDRGDATEASIKAWMDEHAGWAGGWNVSEHEARGVAIATPMPIVARGGSGIDAPGTRWDFEPRLVSAVIETPAGNVAFGSLHLKCCGSLGTEEDVRRLSEARGINAHMREIADVNGAVAIVVGGDFNLNGTPRVMDWIMDGLDADGSALRIAQPRVLGDSAYYTFGQPGTNNTRPRLDFITYPDAAMSVSAGFVLDTSRLSSTALDAMGLEEGDAHASDHLPVVVDLRVRD